MNLVWKLLRQHISIPQFVGFFFANLVGVVIILLGVQFYNDYQSLDQEDSFMKADYMIVNKKIGAFSSLTGAGSSFSKDDIDDIREAGFAEHIGAFTPSSFNVRARFDVQGFVSFSTEMFFESVPDEFVDVATEKWTFTPGDTLVPIILPKNYLDLYNFGFAQSQSLPKISEGIVGMIDMTVLLQGGGQQQRLKAKVIGFSTRLNTILVPESFIQWSNAKFAPDADLTPNRLIVEVKNPTDDAIVQYITQHNLELLKSYGNHIIEPGTGFLASHLEGKGRMEEPENIIKIIDEFFNK